MKYMIQAFAVFSGLVFMFAGCSNKSKKSIDHKDPVLASKIKFVNNNSTLQSEEGTSTSIVIMFNKPTEIDTKIDWTIQNGSEDFEYSSGSVTLKAGESATNFSIKPIIDNAREQQEQFQLFIGSTDSHVEGSLTVPVLIDNITTSADLLILEGSTFSFGTLALQDTHSQLMTIQNSGQAFAQLLQVPTLPPPFGFLGGAFPGTGGTCTLKLDGHTSCTIVISYNPLDARIDNTVLNLNYFDGIDLHPLQLSLNGEGVGINPIITNNPTGRNTTVDLNVSVSGSQITQFKYKLGNQNATNCSSSNGYSDALSLSTLINDNISSLPDGAIRICVLGKNSANVWQSLNTATTAEWIKDTTVPTLNGLTDGLTWTKTKSLSWSCMGDDICTYRFSIDQTPTGDVSSLSYTSSNQTSIDSGNGAFYLHIQAKDSVNLESSVMNFKFNLDNTSPSQPATLNDGLYKASLSESPNLVWTASSDSLSSVDNYEIALGSSYGATDVLDWHPIGSSALSYVLSGLNLSGDTYYYPSVRAIDSAGNASTPVSGDGWLVDITPPTSPVLVNDGFIVNSLTSATISWSAGTDGQSGISSYQVAVGTTADGTDVKDWTDVGTALSTVLSVSLTQGGTYYGRVRVIDNAGNISVPRAGDGWIATGQFSTLQRISDTSLPPMVGAGNEGNNFGSSVAVSEDEQTMVLGAPLDDLDSAGANFVENAGAAYVYAKVSGVWTFQQKIIPTGTNARVANDQFGYSVAISNNSIVVGAPLQDYNNVGASAITNAGAIYVFNKNPSTGIWAQQDKIIPSGSNARISSDQFGWRVDISGDLIAVGAPWQDYDDYGNAAITDAGAVFIYVRDPATGNWSQQQKIIAQGGYARQASDVFGYSLSLNNNTLAVGAYGQDYDSAGNSGTFLTAAGATFVFIKSGTTWTQQAKITPTGTNERNANDQFGISVSLSIDTLAIGANFQSYDESGLNLLSKAGAVYIYIRNPSTGVWSFQQKLVGTGTNGRKASDYFGQNISLNGDSILVGAPLQDWDANGANSLTDAGAGFVFIRNPSTGVWSFQQKITGTGTNARVSNDQFGASLSLVGNSIASGVRLQDFSSDGMTSVIDSGAAFILNRSGATWTLAARFSDNTVPSINRLGSINSAYGSAVAISEDKQFLVVGAPASNVDHNGSNYLTDSGLVYVYLKQNGTWTLQQKLVPTGTNARMASDAFGASVDISGNTLIVGAPKQDYDENGTGIISDAGAAYVFTQDTNGLWTQQAKLIASGLNSRGSGDNFGTSVAIRGDRIVIGSPYHNYDSAGAGNLNDAGAVFLFHRSGSTWTQDFKLAEPSSLGRVTSDQFGFSVAISSGGDFIIAGAPNQDTDGNGLNTVADAGAVFVYKLQTNGSWTFSQKLVPSGTNARISSDKFGFSVAADNQRLAVGSPYHDYDENGAGLVTDAGAAFVFYRSTSTYIQEQKLVGSSSMVNSRIASDNMGTAVGLSGDVVVAGVPGQDYDSNGATNVSAAGAAYVYIRSSGLWVHQQRVTGFGGNSRVTSDDFGRSIAIKGDQLAIGARNSDYDDTGMSYLPNVGAIFTFIF